MTIDISKERVFPYKILAKLIVPSGRSGKPLSTSCLLRWGKRGLVSERGKRIFLTQIRTGEGWGSSIEQVQIFLDRLSDGSNDDGRPRRQPPDTPQCRARSVQAARRALDAAGI